MTKEEYKQKLSWLKTVPKTWAVKPMSLVARERSIKSSDGELLSVYLDRGVIRASDGNLGTHAPSEAMDNYQAIEPGDFILNNQQAWRGSVGVSFESGIISPAYLVLRLSSDMDWRYSNYLFRSRPMVDQFMLASQGVGSIQRQIHAPSFKNVLTIVPPLETQKSIAALLDERTKAIEELITIKEKSIVLLSEKRTALINDLIMTVKGVPSKIKICAKLNPGKSKAPKINPDNKVAFIPMEAISEMGELEPQERLYDDVRSGFTYFENNDVVLAKITPCYENGKAGVITGLTGGFGFGTTEFLVLRPNEKILSEYLYYVVFSDKFRKSGEVEMRGVAGQKRVSNLFVSNYEFTLPSLNEQRAVVKKITEQTQGLLQIIREVNIQIELLKEYRTSLIHSAVIGQIKI